ncbi:MBL fold metallo-hydrolase [Pseudomonas chlororaphis]|uniref:MBL fold metallo-hydrolase n=1 Tax=Pseudomonas chlororaphis TaxID=587753 RepID=A0AB34C4N3_9PSED|nr:MBL fold metallo-hydrolase [Pseudomonas chlororaphis]
MLAPSFSNPASFNIKGFPPLTVSTNREKIRRYMPPASKVTMLLAGHAHYDHLLDVADVVRTKTPNAVVYGSETVDYLLQADKPPIATVVPGRAQISNHKDPSWRGTWFYSSGQSIRDGENPMHLAGGPPKGKIRAMPVNSMHAPHIFGINLLPGAYDDPLEDVPTSVFDWKLGHKTLAWVIDLLGDDGKPVYRIHYQDSAATPPWGFPPLISDSKSFDVVILCAASWDEVSYYPTGLLRATRPRLVLLGHWENFFGNDLEEPAETIPLQDYGGLIQQLDGYQHVVPEPFSEVSLPPPLW